ncbi:pyridoxal phosphate-dependent decarboxylase family protein [Pontibacter roseus]|uniref:pyridoxal phosphate-dependent decarboxylase family protein n=1 Tax=Pontibacter roseus TaxID=336989 RepID=UPI00036AF6A2|nr:pyridoxal-dependent decarboxylase [Pontibacter roseus]
MLDYMQQWPKLSKDTIRTIVFNALEENVNFYEENILGIPGSHLDNKVFYQDAPFLKDAPYLTALIHNPNHIGCHTLEKSESFFKGTHQLERELIALCAEQILQAEAESCDGYVAAGGTEANLQAIWIYRNYFRNRYGVSNDSICILCSRDSHYSMSKAANVFNLDIAFVQVEDDTRSLNEEHLQQVIQEKKTQGKNHFIVVANMMTTMFGSVDNVDTYTAALEAHGCLFRMHVDAAFGGFLYPFTNPDNTLNFRNKHITSVTLDAHKMVQAPYGTGIFLIRKGFMQHANTKEASYVEGEDYTLIGSRSGANAIAVWMILMTYGRYGWEEKTTTLLNRAAWLTHELDKAGIAYYRDPFSNIITIRSGFLNKEIATRYGLVPDNHQQPNWYKVVVMDHVTIDRLLPLLQELQAYQEQNCLLEREQV